MTQYTYRRFSSSPGVMSSGANSMLSCITGSILRARWAMVSRESMLILMLELFRFRLSEIEALLMSIFAWLAEEIDIDIPLLLLLDLVAEPLFSLDIDVLVPDATPSLLGLW